MSNNIDLRRFVNINIQPYSKNIINSTRDTVVLFTSEGTPSKINLVTSLEQAKKDYVSNLTTLAYLKMYFNNGGINVEVHEKIELEALNTEITKLDNKYICIAYASTEINREKTYASLKALANSRSTDSTVYGINEKLILASTSVNSDKDLVKNFVVKYVTNEGDNQSKLGAEMTIAAYLSKINVYGVNSIFDYNFTPENITPEDITDSAFNTVLTNNMNIDIILGNGVKNAGGNCKDGEDVTNSFVRIILHQTLTDAVINTLTQKIKNTDGISKLYTSITQELAKYLTSGYLTTDKVWTEDDLIINYNNVNYTIINKYTALSNGYFIKILPISALSNQDKIEHKVPPIYIILADQYGIRKVTITGKVI